LLKSALAQFSVFISYINIGVGHIFPFSGILTSCIEQLVVTVHRSSLYFCSHHDVGTANIIECEHPNHPFMDL
jgi:hypothetical protein